MKNTYGLDVFMPFIVAELSLPLASISVATVSSSNQQIFQKYSMDLGYF